MLAGVAAFEKANKKTVACCYRFLIWIRVSQPIEWPRNTAFFELGHHDYWRKAAAGGAEIGGLTGIHSRGKEQNLAIVGVGAQIKF